MDTPMIELYYWNTPNGHKITMMLEECELPYRIIPIDIRKNAQFEPSFLAISPNNKIPAIVDPSPPDGQGPLSIFESGPILQYLAEKTGKFLPFELRARMATLQWVAWQIAGFGPMLGQLGHFAVFAKDKIPYAIDRYRNEANRLFSVLDKQLEGKEWVVGPYTIADMAIYPWASGAGRLGLDLSATPNVAAWVARVAARPATVRAYEKGDAAIREYTQAAGG